MNKIIYIISIIFNTHLLFYQRLKQQGLSEIEKVFTAASIIYFLGISGNFVN